MRNILNIFILSILCFAKAYSQSELWNNYLQSSPRGQGSTLANYSYAGYHYCEKELPTVTEIAYAYFNVTDYGAVANDNRSDREALLNTIEAAEKHDGKAVIYFPEGRFNLNGKDDFGRKPIVITKSNIVVKGAGQDVTDLYFDQPSFLNSEPLIRFTPSYPNTSYWRGDEKLSDIVSYPERGGLSLTVTNASKFKPGQAVNIDADLHSRSERGKGYFAPHTVPEGVDDIEDYLFEMHIVDRVEGNIVFFKEPIQLDLPHMQDAFIRDVKTIIQECGMEDLSISGNYREQFKHHNGSRFGERYDLLHLQDARNCWVRNVRFINYSNAINLHRVMASSFLNVNLVGHTGHNSVGGVYSTGNLFMFMRENTQTHHGFGGDHSLVGSVFCRCNQYDGPEAHCAWPRATLYDLNMGGFKPRPGGAKKFPHHGTDLCFWNWNVTQSGTKDFWPDGENYGYFIPPVIAGLHGEPFTIPNQATDLKANESPGTKIMDVESLFESQLEDRLGELPTWLKDLSSTFEAINRNAGISITSPTKFSVLSSGNNVEVTLKTPDNFPVSAVKRVELLLSKTSLFDGFEKVAESDGWMDEITFSTHQRGSIVLKAMLYYGHTEVEESEPITLFVGDPSSLARLSVKKAEMLTNNKRKELYGEFTTVGGAEAESFPENNAYNKYKNGSAWNTVEKEFYKDQLATYAKFGREKIKPALEEAATQAEIRKLIDNNTSSTIANIYGNTMLQFDLGNEYSVVKIELLWNASLSPDIKLEVQTSSDSLAWYSFVNDEPLWEFGVQHIGKTLSREKLTSAKVHSIYIPQKHCRYIRLSTQGFSNNRLAEVRFYGTDIPKLKKIVINGATPSNFDADLYDYEVSLEEGTPINIIGIAENSNASVVVTEPDSYPGTAIVSVMDELGAINTYHVNILLASSYLEDFEKASSGSIAGVFVGNKNVNWNLEGRFSSNMGTGKCLYYYPTQTGIESFAISGGLSEISFDAENLTQSGGRTIRVSVNNFVLIDSLFEAEDVYNVAKTGLQISGDFILKIENLTEGTKKLGIDNIAWKGFAPDRNAFLKSITVNGLNIDNFDKNTFSYVQHWKQGMDVEISAEAISEKAKVDVSIKESNPPVGIIRVTAANDDWSEYNITFDPTLLNAEANISNLVIYPNPANSTLTVEGLQLQTLIIRSANGQILLRKRCVSRSTSLNLSDFRAGLYVLEVINTNGIKQLQKVILNK